uniref:ABC-type glutathione-S-conjugate transporter n=1 Tax=Plectus sambesii TaxID=2011161 RepID=A0A914WXI5_9BILA
MEKFGNFCDTPLWNYTDSRNASFPVMTPCFQHTICPSIPLSFVLLFTPFLVAYCSRHHDPSLKWTKRLIYKLCLTCIAVVLSLAQLYLVVDGWLPDVLSYYISGVFTFITAIDVLLLLLLCVSKGVVTSGVLHITWMLVLVSDIPQLLWWIEQFKIQSDLSSVPCGPVRFAFFVSRFLTSLQLVFIHCFADVHHTTGYENLTDSDNTMPELKRSFLNRITYWWASVLVKKGYYNPLTMGDFWKLSARDRCQALHGAWRKLWEPAYKEYDRKRIAFQSSNQSGDKKAPKMPSVLLILVKICWRTLTTAFALVFPYLFLEFCKPYLLKKLIEFVDHPDQPLWKGIFFALLMFLTTSINSLVNNYYFLEQTRGAINIKSVLFPAVFSKTLKLSNAARKDKTAGEIVNLVAVDIDQIEDIFFDGILLFTAPVKMIISMIMIYQLLGTATFFGVGVMALLIPINIVMVNRQKKLQVKQMEYKDDRLKLMNEILNGMKVLKLYAWEPSMEKLVSDIREKEMREHKYQIYTNIVQDASYYCTPFFASIAAFAAYTMVGSGDHLLTPSKAFVSLTLFNMMRWPLASMPHVVLCAVRANVSLKRIAEFLTSEELNPNAVEHSKNENAVELQQCTMSWSPETITPEEQNAIALKDISLAVKRGELVAVVGKVGTGKSSLLSAIMGEMYKTKGRVLVNGSMCYVPQQAWIQNMTVRENILFGSPFNQQRYDQVVEGCALLPDFAVLQAGDKTEIGEKGINLSGGQRARVSMARAVYQNNDIYLLDDPISAVDSHVARHLFTKVIGQSGILANKTRILVTHSLTHLKHVDRIIVMTDGRISEVGTYDQLIKDGGAFADILREYLAEMIERQKSEHSVLSGADLDDIEEDDALNAILSELTAKNLSALSSPSVSRQTSVARQTSITRQTSRQPRTHNISVSSDTSMRGGTKDRPPESEVNVAGTLIEEEEVETGSVEWGVYGMYARAAGLATVTGYLLSIIVGGGGFEVASSFWLADWSTDSTLQRNATHSTGERLAIYGALGMSQALFVGISTFFVAIGSYTASKRMHGALVHNLMRCPMAFFDTTPLGRIINRISKDMDKADDHLPQGLSYCIAVSNDVIVSLIIIGVSTPVMVVGIIPIIIIFVLIYRYYVRVSRQLRRLFSTSFSFVCSHLQDSIAGVSSIRAFKAQDRFCDHMEKLTDTNVGIYYHSMICNRWMQVRTDFVSNVLVLITALAAVYFGRYSTLSAGILGLTVSYSLNITGYFGELCRNWREVETNIVSIERIKEYSSKPTEADWESSVERKPPASWPTRGSIKFDRYSLRYRSETDLVLKQVSVEINGGEKIGIVGRTGAGKSSLTLALFRIVESAEGSIEIDGVDIASIGLHDLRNSLTIIPQDPVLFSGSLRMNLDPFGNYSDSELWTALERAHLKPFALESADKLDQIISEGGGNLSVGQRQLLCLARALLRKTRVLVLDEATAAVDVQTDANIQATIREEFADCTILTIAHRLNTIMDYDRVIVLDAGQVREFDSPGVLIRDHHSAFHAMAVDAGLTS